MAGDNDPLVKQITKGKLIKPLALRKIVELLGARCLSQTSQVATLQIQAVATDTRLLSLAESQELQPLFIALRGENFLGHEFVQEAITKGARAVVIDEKAREHLAAKENLATCQVPLLVVPDTLVALGEIARYLRGERSQDLVIGITGSNGKTTTKEMLYAILKHAGCQVSKSQGNLNNLIGLPLTIFNWPKEHSILIAEMGMSALGEIARLAAIGQPQLGLVTNVTKTHLEKLGSIENIAKAKGELYAGLSQESTAIVNADDQLIQQESGEVLAKLKEVWTFGSIKESNVRLEHAALTFTPELGTSLEFTIQTPGQAARPLSCWVPLLGEHNGLNAAAAVAAALSLKISDHDIIAGLRQVSLPAGRLKIGRFQQDGQSKEIYLIDDTYNASPKSLKAALSMFSTLLKEFKKTGRVERALVILGDMLELGVESVSAHQQAGELAVQAGVNKIFAYGNMREHILKGARALAPALDIQIFAKEDFPALLAAVRAVLAPGDLVLIKGSRGMHLERLVAGLKEHLSSLFKLVPVLK